MKTGADLIVGGEIVLAGPVVLDEFAAWFADDEAFFSPRLVREALARIDGPATIRLTSGGGHAAAGAAIHAVLAGHEAGVRIVVEGLAASAASLLLMAGNPRQIADGSLIMIHDPSGLVWGAEADMRKAADDLAVMAGAYAAVYAAASGQTPAECRTIMQAETWLDAAGAVAAGFADAAVPAPAAASALAPRFASIPAAKAAVAAEMAALQARLAKPLSTAAGGQPADPAKSQEASVPKQTTAADPAATTVPAGTAVATPPVSAAPASPAAPAADAATRAAIDGERARQRAIRSMAAPHLATGELAAEQVEAMIEDDISVDAAAARILASLAAAQGPQTRSVVSPARVTGDHLDRQADGMKKALYAKTGLKDGERNEFSSMSLREMARATLTARNLQPKGGVLEMISAAFVPTMAGAAHSTSDFAAILADVANKSMMKGFNEADETFQQFTSVGSASDFKPTTRVGVAQFPSLAKVAEGGEYTFGTIAGYSEQVVLATYGKMFAITRQTIVNDDLDAFSKIPMMMGRAALRTVGGLVYAVLTGNPDMADNVALFHATHANLAGSGAAPGEATINAAITAMTTQTDRSANAAALNIAPKYLIAGPAQRSAVLQALNSEYAPDDTAKVGTAKQPYAYNTVRDAAIPIFDARISGNAWFMAADPSRFDTIEVAYLDGDSEPFLDQQDGWKVDGTEFKVRIDAAVKALAWEGLYKNPGQ